MIVIKWAKSIPRSAATLKAGAGKSYLVQFIIAALGLNPQTDVCFAAPTGKAAQVLKKRGNPNAMTLHKLLYKARQNKSGQYRFVPRIELENEYKLIIVDEVSMVPPNIWKQLLKHRIPVIALGDIGQLPPVSPDGDNGVLANPHVTLTQIMRQGEGNEIIDFATYIRQGSNARYYKGRNQQVMVISQQELTTGHYLWANQILCAKNDTRIQGNLMKRQLLGRDADKPNQEDLIISLKNHWNFASINGEPLINGSIGKILDYEVTTVHYPSYIYSEPYQLMLADLETEDGDIFKGVPIDYNCLLTGNKTLTDKQEMLLKKEKEYEIPFEMNYSYFATVWKFQGDQANKVLLFEENFPFDADTHRRYMYTGATRAVEKLVVVTNK